MSNLLTLVRTLTYIICQKIEGKRILINPDVYYDVTLPDSTDRIKLIKEEHPDFSGKNFNISYFFKNYKKHIKDSVEGYLYIEPCLKCKFDSKIELIDSSLHITNFEPLKY